MRIRSGAATPYRLSLRSPWHSSQSAVRVRRGWLIILETRSGETGYGDCAPLPETGTEPPAQSQAWLSLHLPALTGAAPEEVLAALPPKTDCPAARCGLETALLDLVSQQHALPLRRWLDPLAADRIRVNAALGATGPGLTRNTKGALRNGFKTLKIKVGAAPLTQELRQLHTLARQLPEGAWLRLDANRAWSPDEASRFIRGITSLPIESLEEPLREPDLSSLGDLQAHASFDIALDESLSLIGLTQLAATRAVHRVVLKPTARGGLLVALNEVREARTAGITSVVTSSLESAAGIWAATQLAAAIDADSAQTHGLATSEWLLQDLGTPPSIRDGLIRLSERPGAGFRPGG